MVSSDQRSDTGGKEGGFAAVSTLLLHEVSIAFIPCSDYLIVIRHSGGPVHG